jgi:hypothetical protein
VFTKLSPRFETMIWLVLLCLFIIVVVYAIAYVVFFVEVADVQVSKEVLKQLKSHSNSDDHNRSSLVNNFVIWALENSKLPSILKTFKPHPLFVNGTFCFWF